VLDSVDENQARVRAARAGPLAKDLRKVGDVVGDENAPVLARQREDVVIIESLELGLLVEGTDVVAVGSERSTDARPRDVGVEEQAHLRLLGDLQEGVESSKLLERATVRLEESFDLVREAFCVGSGKPKVTVAHERVALAKLLGVAAVRAKEVDDLPHVEPTSDDPGATWPGPVANSWEEAHLGRLLRELFDDGTP
jgi:hypothetical protein